MRCKRCGRDANVHIRAHNIALCAEDFLSFLERRVSETTRKYGLISKGQRALVCVSGGKDSLSLWYILNNIGIEADGFHIHLGIGAYSDKSLSKVEQMAERLARKVHVTFLQKTLGQGIAELAKRLKRQTCSLCGTLKRYLMNRVAIEKDYDVLVLGHNLDDEASALLGNILYWRKEYLWRKHISLEGIEGHLAKKVKPLFLISEREMASYAFLRGIDYVTDECPYAAGAKTLLYKELLNRVEEESPGTKIRFVMGYLAQAGRDGEKRERQFCKLCGYPSYAERCVVCRILERFGTGRPVAFEVYPRTG